MKSVYLGVPASSAAVTALYCVSLLPGVVLNAGGNFHF